jgi:hypothetical protein
MKAGDGLVESLHEQIAKSAAELSHLERNVAEGLGLSTVHLNQGVLDLFLPGGGQIKAVLDFNAMDRSP